MFDSYQDKKKLGLSNGKGQCKGMVHSNDTVGGSDGFVAHLLYSTLKGFSFVLLTVV
jgi:hypothetical protein